MRGSLLGSSMPCGQVGVGAMGAAGSRLTEASNVNAPISSADRIRSAFRFHIVGLLEREAGNGLPEGVRDKRLAQKYFGVVLSGNLVGIGQRRHKNHRGLFEGVTAA